MFALGAVGCAAPEVEAPRVPDRVIRSARVVLDTPAVTLMPPSAAAPIGEVTGAAYLPDGRLVVLDHPNYRLVTFLPSGAVEGTVGREGDGPGEFRRPEKLFLVDGHAVVYDGGPSRFTWIDPGPPATVLREIRAANYSGAICVAGEDLMSVTFDPRSGSLVHQITSDGRRIKSFGPALYPRGSLSVQDWARLNGGGSSVQLSCRTDSPDFVYSSSLKAVVRRARNDGTQIWETAITGLILPRFELFRTGTIQGFQEGEDVHQRLTTIHFLSPDLVLVQIGETTREIRRSYGINFSQIISVLIDFASGAEVGRQVDLPLIKAATDQRLLTVTLQDDLLLADTPFHLEVVR